MAALSTSYDTVSGQESTLAVNIDATQTTGIKIAPMNLNGDSSVPWESTSGVLKVEQEIDGTRKVEWIAYGGTTTNADDTVTLSDVSRNVSRTGSSFTGTGTGQAFDKGSKVKLVDFHLLLNKKANVDRNNSWTEHQTVATGKEWRFKNSSQAIYESGDELYLKSSTTAAKSLAQLAAAAGTDEKVKVSIDDTTGNYLASKITGGDGIAVTETNGGGNETLDIDVDLGTDPGLEFVSGGLEVKVKADGGITKDSNGLSITSSFQVPVGAMLPWPTSAAPTGWLACYGQAVSRSTYATLFAVLVKSSTVTITIASPGVVTWTGHTLSNGDKVEFSTTGALPTGISAATTYYVINAATDTFQLAATVNGSAINTTGSQSGTHTAVHAPHGKGDGSTTFNLPDMRGRFPLGKDDLGGSSANHVTAVAADGIGSSGGTDDGAHTHTIPTTGSKSTTGSDRNEAAATSGSTSVMPPYLTVNYIIKT